jgi:hypothetical protein
MTSSGDSGGNPAALLQGGTPMPGLPIAGQGGGIGDPYQYGQFQNFLPDIPSEGPAPSATGLRPDMFQYKKPNGGVDPQIQQLRDQLAALTGAGGASGTSGAAADPSAGVGTMGLGGGGGGMFGGGDIQGPPGPPGSNPVAQSNARVVFPVPGWGPAPSVGNQFPTDWRTKDAAGG